MSKAVVISAASIRELSCFVPRSCCSTAFCRYFGVASAQTIRQLCISGSLNVGDIPHGRDWLLRVVSASVCRR